MVSLKTSLNIYDNTGAVFAECIKTYGFSKRNNAKVGQYILSSVKRATPGRKIKKGSMHKVLITQSRRPLHRKDGTIVELDRTGGVLIKEYLPVGTRINRLISFEVRMNGYSKVVSLSPIVV